jgi:pyrimidine operon attenuation protein/uracil phosphoribosyltransferase
MSLRGDSFVDLSHLANNAYLRKGFESHSIREGFVTGNIHLPSGRIVPRYFSLGNNCAQEADANTRRWSVAAHGVFEALQERIGGSAADTTLLGCSAAAEPIVGGLLASLGSEAEGFTLASYDVPPPSAVRGTLDPSRPVVLVTDVVSSCALVKGITDLLWSVGREVRGILALVDARAERATPDAIEVDGKEIPFCSAAVLPPSEGTPSDLDYWVDPVSLVPSPERRLPQVDPRVFATLRDLAETDSVRTGHIVDGVRHASVYVDLRSFLAAASRGAFVDDLRAKLEAHLCARGWPDFAPSLAIYPSPLPRMSRLGRTEARRELRSDAATATSLYVSMLQQIWPSASDARVTRHFEPAGTSRCARAVRFPPGEHADVLLVDDGVWSGRTIHQLLEIVREQLDAKRILAAPLLARLPPRELRFWESIQSVAGRAESSPTIAFSFYAPMVLPVPYYKKSECPYEGTLRELDRLAAMLPPALASVAKRLARGIDQQHPDAARRAGNGFESTWMRLRTLAELAAEDEDGVDSVRREIKDLSTPEGIAGALNLFLDEWWLLRRGRLREGLGSYIEVLAVSTALDLRAPAESRATALALLRSLFPGAFANALGKMVAGGLLLHDEAALARVAFNIATSSEDLRRRSELRAFLDSSQVAPMEGVEPRVSGSGDVYEALAAARVIIQAPQDVARAVDVLEATRALDALFTGDPSVSHQIGETLATFASREQLLLEYSPASLADLWILWREQYLPKVTAVINALPMLQRPISVLSRWARPEDARGLEYLRASADDRNADRPAALDLAMLALGLEMLGSGKVGPRFARMVFKAARSLHSCVVGGRKAEGTLAGVLKTVRSLTARTFVDWLIHEIDQRGIASGRLRVEQVWEDAADASFFCSPAVARACAASVASNLKAYAFNEREGATPIVQISAKPGSSRTRRATLISVRNSGARLVRDRVSPDNRSLDSDMRAFGGRFSGPVALDEVPWRVEQSIIFRTW